MTRARAAILVGIIVVAAYSNAPSTSFQFDDWNVILRDPHVRSISSWWAGMPGIRPLLKLSYAANRALGGGAPAFHAVNVAIHLANAMLVLVLLRRLATIHGASEREGTFASLGGALLFALHPIQTEAVTYVCGRSVSLSALFALGSIVAWIEGRERGRRLVAFGLSPLLAACAVATKEPAIAVLPALALLAASDPRSRSRAREVRLALFAHGPVVVAALAAILASPIYRHLLRTSLAARGIGTNLITQATAIAWLAGQIVRPILVADPKLPEVTSWSPFAIAAAAAIVASLAVGVLLLRLRPAVGLGILWFFVWLAPTNSILPRLDVANDRQAYLALIGPAWILAWTLSRVMAERRGIAAAALAACLALGAATYARNRVYATEITFWEDVGSKAPHNGRAFNNLGYAYAISCRKEDAEAAFVRARALDPADYTAPINLMMLRDGSLPGLVEAACGHE